MYADDTVLYIAFDKKLPPDTIANFQTDLHSIAKWCYQNKLSINEKKTQVMILGSTACNPLTTLNTNLTLNATPLSITTQYKYLGVTLNPSLTHASHVSSIIRTVYCKINSLSYLCDIVGKKTSLQIYKTTILPLLEYSNVIFSLLQKKDRSKFQRLQNRALRVIFPNIHSTDELHTLAKLSTLESRADSQLVCLMYKRAHYSDDYPMLPNTGSTRANHKIRFDIPRPRYERFKAHPLYHGAHLWDKLDASTQKAVTYQHFKSQIRSSASLIRNRVSQSTSIR